MGEHLVLEKQIITSEITFFFFSFFFFFENEVRLL